MNAAEAEAVGVHGVAAGHERGCLLVTRDHRLDLAGMLERQHQAGGVLAGAAEGGLDADALEASDDRFVHPHRSHL